MDRSILVSTLARGALFAAVVCSGAHTASAQGVGLPSGFGGMQSASPPSFSGEQADKSLQSGRPPPAALPGASNEQAIAPPSKTPSLMSPTEELFDAINRGDMLDVRDAVSRGADLSTKNELGLTPLDLAIDLNRNDISFLLLSLREPTPSGPPVAKAANPVKTVPRVAPGRPLRETARTTAAHPTGQMSLPALFANNGGAPVPRAGFLGFSGR